MARFVWLIRAYSCRDGEWKRFIGHFPTYQDALMAVHFIWPLVVLAGDYHDIDIIKTIAFERERGLLATIEF